MSTFTPAIRPQTVYTNPSIHEHISCCQNKKLLNLDVFQLTVDRTMQSITRQDRAIGALVGLAIGDALGTTLEFASRDSRPLVTDIVGGGPFGLKPGVWTDDTSMVLSLAESINC